MRHFVLSQLDNKRLKKREDGNPLRRSWFTLLKFCSEYDVSIDSCLSIWPLSSVIMLFFFLYSFL